ncbi:MAG TPA: hypothetical protein VII34_01880 [Pyrinomonadaceae bacterium]
MDKLAQDSRTIDLKLLQRHPLKVVVAAFLLTVAIVVSVFVFVYVPSELKNLHDQLNDCQTAKSQAEAKIPVPPEDPDALQLTPAEVGEEYWKRNGRSAEQDSFSQSLNGKNVHWEVEVTSVTKGLGYVHFRHPDPGSSCAPVSMAVFGPEIRERAESLQSGDVIRVHGALAYNSQNFVNIRATSFDFVRAAKAASNNSK